MMEKLVLIQPPSPWLISDRDLVANGPLYISAYLKSYGFEVQVVDLAGLPEKYWHIPVGDIYGIGGTTPHFIYMKKIIEKLKYREPNKLVVVGGVHASALPGRVLTETKADGVVVGEGELAMLTIMEQGFVKKIQSGVPMQDLDNFPFPDREAIDLFDYLQPGIHGYLVEGKAREVSMLTGRGCPYRCAFCSSCNHWGKPRFRSPENVIKEIIYLRDTYNVRLINFNDDTFTINKERLHKLLEMMEGLGVNFYALSRADTADPKTFELMKKAGCKSVTFGYETGSERMLEVLRKGHTLQQSYASARVAKEAGLQVKASIMVGLPTETEEDVEMTADFLRKAELDTVSVHIFQPYPGSDIWDHPDKYGIEIDKDTDFSTYHTCGKPEAKVAVDEKIHEWHQYLREAGKGKNIELDKGRGNA
jgi:radical SAM superfamily enzyme YgiQ (UPF0313 family)